MIKYYVYQEHSYDIQKTMQSISGIYNTEEIISLPEKSYLLRVPFIQRYEGVALVVSSSLLLTNMIDLENLDFHNSIGITNRDNTLFIINCGHEYASNNLNKTNMVISPLRTSDVLKIRWDIQNLDDFVSKQEDDNVTFLGQAKNENIVSE